jgi:hypothetical protein
MDNYDYVRQIAHIQIKDLELAISSFKSNLNDSSYKSEQIVPDMLNYFSKMDIIKNYIDIFI